MVVKYFPKSAKAPDALYNAGVLRQALGQHDKAIAHFQAYAKKYDDRKDAAEVAFRIGVVYEEAGDDGHADAAYRSYAKNYRDNPRRVIEAHVRAARTSLALGQWKRTADELDETSKAYKRADPKDRAATRTWAAEGRYLEGELVLRDYEKVSLDVKPKLLQKTLKKKSELLGKAQGIYLSVVDYEDLKWATASLYRVGQIYDSFAEALRTAPTPAGLSEAEATAYREALDSYVLDIEEKAIELYSTGYAKAIQMQVYDGYTKKIRDALGRLSSQQYPPRPGPSISMAVTTTSRDGIAVITFDNPPVNGMGIAVRRGLLDALAAAKTGFWQALAWICCRPIAGRVFRLCWIRPDSKKTNSPLPMSFLLSLPE